MRAYLLAVFLLVISDGPAVMPPRAEVSKKRVDIGRDNWQKLNRFGG